MRTMLFYFFFSSRRRHTRYIGDWSSDVCSSDLYARGPPSHCCEPTSRAWAKVIPPGRRSSLLRSELRRRSGEIGRASCRKGVERGGGGCIKKKKRKRREYLAMSRIAREGWEAEE